MHIIWQAVLPKLTIVYTIKRSVLYGPLSLQGMGFKNVYVLQGAAHPSFLLQFMDTNTDSGKLLKDSMESITLELGMGENIFAQDYIEFGF